MHLNRADCRRLGIDPARGRLVTDPGPSLLGPSLLGPHLPPTGEPGWPGLVRAAGAVSLGMALPDGPPGRWVVTVPFWRPTLDNQLVGVHWAIAARRKAADAEIVYGACLAAGVTRPLGRRKVRVRIMKLRGRWPDGPAILKSFHDALTVAGAIIDDSDRWLDWGPPAYGRGELGTVIKIKDIEG